MQDLIPPRKPCALCWPPSPTQVETQAPRETGSETATPAPCMIHLRYLPHASSTPHIQILQEWSSHFMSLDTVLVSNDNLAFH